MPGDLIEASAETSTILVVDDEPVVRGLLGRWIVGAGYHCTQAGDARAAWDCLQSGGVDLVMSDINMPGESGVELLVRTRQAFPDTPILMLTALGSARAAIDALTAGACGYLIKPVEREELLFQVRQGLERRQLLLDRRRYVESLQRRVQEQTSAVRQAHEETIHRLLTATMYRDEETGAHIRRTGLFSEVLALAAGWARGEAERLRMAAPMHDVGKIGIPDNVLLKPGK
ncbi:MAG: response regulator, partial [Pirellulales bacterium]